MTDKAPEQGFFYSRSPYKAVFDIKFPNEPDEGIPYRLRRYCQPAFWHAGMRSGAGL